LSRQAHWAKECVARLQASKDASDRIAGNRLSQHMDNITAAMDIMDKLAQPSKSFSDISAPLTALIKAKVDFDSAIKCKLLGKFLIESVQDMLADGGSDNETRAFVEAISPFSAVDQAADDSDVGEKPFEGIAGLGAEASENDQFDPMKPKLRHIEGNMSSKCLLAEKILMNDVVPKLVGFGDAGLVKIALICQAMAHTYEEAIAGMAEAPASAQQILIVCRILEVVADSSTLNFDPEDIYTMVNDKSSATKSSLSDLAILLDGVPFWQARLADVCSMVQNDMQTVEDIRQHINLVPTWPNTFEVASCTQVLETLALIRKAQATSRAGLALRLERCTCDRLKETLRAFQANGNWDFNTVAPTTLLESILQVVRESFALWREAIFNEACVAAQAEHEKRQAALTIQQALELAVTLAGAEGIADDQAAKFESSMGALVGSPLEDTVANGFLDTARKMREKLSDHFPEIVNLARCSTAILDIIKGLERAPTTCEARSTACFEALFCTRRSPSTRPWGPILLLASLLTLIMQLCASSCSSTLASRMLRRTPTRRNTRSACRRSPPPPSPTSASSRRSRLSRWLRN